MRILIAPDKFKFALTAAEAAGAIADGVAEAAPRAELDRRPLGDGGEGTGRILAEALGAVERSAPACDPLGRPRTAPWWLAPDGAAIIEMAEASGLALLKREERAPLDATSYGTGELIAAAVAAGATNVTLCVGGSATVEGGAGCLQALGFVLRDAHGAALAAPVRARDLERIARIEPPRARPPVMTVLCDVTNPLLGADGAAPAFAPQKGAAADDVLRLAHGLQAWARVLHRDFGVDVSAVPATGAAGGLPAGMLAACGARLRPGFDEVARQTRLRERMSACQLVLTGEGRLDAQSAQGKVVSGVAKLAQQLAVPAVALVGETRLPPGAGLTDFAAALGLSRIVTINPPGMPLDLALQATAWRLRVAAAAVLREHW
jgi:glycerate kinase